MDVLPIHPMKIKSLTSDPSGKHRTSEVYRKEDVCHVGRLTDARQLWYNCPMHINISTRTAADAKDLLAEQLQELPTADLKHAIYALFADRIDLLPPPPNGMSLQVTAQVIIEADIALRIS
jgi:hypothetical protein